MRRIERTLKGFVRAEIQGPEPQSLLNACMSAGVRVSGPDSLDAFTLRLGVEEKDLPRLEELAARCGCELRILSRSGGSRNRLLLRRRLGLLSAGVLLLAGLLFSSLFIWEIRVVGGEEISRGRLLRALEDCGVKTGSYWPGIDTDDVRDRMLLQLPELAWMTVNIRGSTAELRLLPRADKPEIWRESEAADLLAGHTGIVRRVSALSGRPLVQPGQAVTEGEVLIASGLESLTAAPRAVRARGEVWADTWYEMSAVCPRVAGKSREGGGLRGRIALKIGDTRINFYQNSGKAIDGCDKIVHEYTLGVSGLFRLPVSLIREELRPYRAEEAPDLTEALQQRLMDALTGGIEGEVVSAAWSVSEKDGVLIVTLRARCLENIARLSDGA